MSKTTELLSLRLNILEMMEAGKSVGQIAKALNLTRLRVYDEINSAQQGLKVQLDAQIASVVRDTIATLAAMAEEIRKDAEDSADGVEQTVQLLLKRAKTIELYCMLYDRGMKLVGEYWKRTMPPSLPTPDEVEAQIKLLEERRDQETIDRRQSASESDRTEGGYQEGIATAIPADGDGDGERDGP